MAYVHIVQSTSIIVMVSNVKPTALCPLSHYCPLKYFQCPVSTNCHLPALCPAFEGVEPLEICYKLMMLTKEEYLHFTDCWVKKRIFTIGSVLSPGSGCYGWRWQVEMQIHFYCRVASLLSIVSPQLWVSFVTAEKGILNLLLVSIFVLFRKSHPQDTGTCLQIFKFTH